MTQHVQSKTRLNNGIEMPWLGLGVFKVEEGSELVEAVKAAVKHGYRSIDTAAVYANETSVGQGIREALADNGLKREDLFVTSKVWNADLGYESTIAAYETSLKKLGLDYLDLYLIHWPVAGKYKEAWRAMEQLYKDGRVKSIGVSNFQVHHLEDLMKDAEIVPVVNQVEFHPMLTQKELRGFTKQHNIQLEAWSPLMQGELLNHPLLKEIADKYGKSIAQVILRWDLQHGVVTIPKSTKEHRIVENASLFDFELSQEDMDRIDGLNENRRVGPDPDNFDF
ncbi:diketogulonate reductase-like aldo/keto reductase [Paenibacillus rhizosphaerae]|uniref:Diketogulonate reductase-like aldo/keto reductase n=1 Tax=Paenibacillus rhizosphaerae TaxID=297318 RepID=A0A839TI94_9BACL|nr:aldo/keto reductase [Paenibacillus rhizosphaerae]MBB3126394.1 diketogulonate reductase-like aldo/keto reductase [Paenibacillus rhizosphaerae]